MFSGELLENFARLAVKIGVNLQKGQGLEIICPVEKYQVAEALTKAGYEAGAKIVQVRWSAQNVDKINYENAELDVLTDIPKWYVDSKNHLVENGFCYIAVSAEDPTIFKDVPAEKIAKIYQARSKALKKYSDAIMGNAIRWCVVSVPTYAWAKQVFPNSDNPEKDLADTIKKTMRLDTADPVSAWQQHIEKLNSRAEFLNYSNFEYIHFSNSIGTNLKVGLAENHVWTSAREKAKDGVHFVANMPTEEVFTAPHRLKVDGVVKSALPLCENGQVIDNFSLTFKNGEVVDFSAEKGYDTLKNLIETDSGTKRIGEIALIGKNSPIAKANVLFYNTLFDENASCHLALGKAYPTTVKGGDNLTEQELMDLGLNDSVEHIDFMIGTLDLAVTGIKKDGTKIPLFIDGEWVI